VSDAYDQIVGLRALREFRDEPLSDEDLSAILEAARWTGSSKNSQRWSFVVVDDPEQRQRLAEAGDFTGPVLAAPLTVALVQESGGNRFDIGRVAQNIMLAAGAVGVASCPVTLHREGVAAEVLGLPEGANCRYAVTLGYPTSLARPARFGGRRPIDELVHHNRYGE
jgi:nitroreductase